MTTTEELRRIFRFRERMDSLTREISRAESENSSATALRLERASLNFAMMRDYGVCIDLANNQIVAFESEPIRAQWVKQLQSAMAYTSGALLQGVIRVES